MTFFHCGKNVVKGIHVTYSAVHDPTPTRFLAEDIGEWMEYPVEGAPNVLPHGYYVITAVTPKKTDEQ